MKQLFYICVSLLLVIESHATISWSQGSIVLKDNTVLVGEVSVEGRYHAVLFRNESMVDVYPAHRIQSVHFYDEVANINRKFISIQSSSVIYQSYELYEVVVSGEISLLRKEETDVAVMREDHEALGYQYLVRYKGEFSSLKQFRSKIYPKIKDMPGVELHSYLKLNKLNPNKAANAVRIIQYYNQMIATVSDLAMN